MSIPVFSSLTRYRGAIAELPATARASDSPDGAVVVVDGRPGWEDDAILALSAGAAALIVSRPSPADRAALERLAGAAVVLERPLLRPDIEADVIAARASVAASPALVLECHAPAPALRAALQDAVGWARILTGGPLRLRAAWSAGGRGTALLDAGDAASVSVVVGTSAGAPPAGRLRATALGETLLELEVEEGDVRFAVTDASSRRIWPTRFESPERVALRRAADAVREGSVPPDLADLLADGALAEAIADARATVRADVATS